jgi:peroxiredoxin
MIASICLLTCVFAAGQSAGRADWSLLPRLAHGQELVYRGSFTERSLSPNVLFERTYRVETSLFVLDDLPRRWQVAFLTTLTPKDGPAGREGPGKVVPSSVRLELVEVGAQGQLTPAPRVSLLVPLEGPPTLEAGAVLEVPATRVGPGSSWMTAEPGRPARTWRVAGTEVVCSTMCVKLVGEQQSADWDRPRANTTAWWRRDTVWIAPQLGIAYRVEREIKRREPLHSRPTYQSLLRYERDTRLTYPGKLFEYRRDEALQARRFADEAAPLLAQPETYRERLDALLRKIAFHLENHPPTPYRPVVLQVQHRIEAARRGEVVVPVVAPEPAPVGRASPGQQAPDFLVTDLVSKQTVRLYRYLGKPVVLVFYLPGTEASRQVLDFARDLAASRKGVTILALSMSEDEALARRQRAELHLPFVVADGRGLRVVFGVQATPQVMVLDNDGTVRAVRTGWGRQTPGEIRAELERLLPRAEK